MLFFNFCWGFIFAVFVGVLVFHIHPPITYYRGNNVWQKWFIFPRSCFVAFIVFNSKPAHSAKNSTPVAQRSININERHPFQSACSRVFACPYCQWNSLFPARTAPLLCRHFYDHWVFTLLLSLLSINVMSDRLWEVLGAG